MRLRDLARLRLRAGEVELHLRVLGQSGGGGHEIVQRLLRAARQEGQPAIGVLEGRHVGALEPPRDPLGAGDGLGIVAGQREKAGEVVGDHQRGPVPLVDLLVDGDGAGDVALLLQRAGAHPLQLGAGGSGGGPFGDHLGRGFGSFRGGGQPRQGDPALCQGGIGVHGGAQRGLGLVAAVRRGQRGAEQELRSGPVGLGGGQFLGAGHRFLEPARRDVGPHQGGLGADPERARLAGQIGQEPLELVRALLRREGGGAEGLGRGAALLVGQGVQPLHDLVEAHPVAPGEIEPAGGLQEARIVGGEAQRVGQHARGDRPASAVDQELGIAERLVGCRARKLHRARQHLAGEVGVAVQEMCLRHQGHDLGIARRGPQGGAQRGDRRVRIVVLQRPGSPELEGVGAGRIDGKRTLHRGARAHPVARGEAHARQRHMETRELGRIERGLAGIAVGLVEKLGHRADGGLGLAGLEVEAGAHRPQEHAVGRVLGGEKRVELGAQRLRPAHLLKELEKRDPILPDRVLRVDPGAQERLGPVLVAFRQHEAQVGLGDLPVLGKELGRLGELGAEGFLVLHAGEDADPEPPELALVLVERQPVIDQREGRVGPPLAQDAVDHHETGRRERGVVRQHRAGGLRRGRGRGVVLGGGRVAIGQRGGRGAQPRIVGRGREPGLRVAAHLVPVAPVHRQQRQGAPGVQVVGILLDQPQIVAVGARVVAVRHEQLGIGLARVAVKAVQVEHVPEFELGTHRIARGDQPERFLIVRLGPLLRALAGRQEGEGEDGKGTAKGHGTRVRTRAGNRIPA